jgi:hypothetical protein
MKVKFLIDKKFDVKTVYWILSSKDPAGTASRAKSMGIPLTTARKFKNKTWKEVQNLSLKLADKRYCKHLGKMKESVANYQKAWNEIGQIFSKEIEKLTGKKWKFENYYVVVSAIHKGTSSRDGNKVCRIFGEDPKAQLRVTAHELLMTHIWHILDTDYCSALDDYKGWALNEITTTFILSFEEKLCQLWPSSSRDYKVYLRNYPQLWEPREKLKEIWLGRKDFNDYMNKSISVLKTYELR